MAADEKWYFTKEQLLQSPSRKSGYDVDKELSCRQQAANFIQDMGQRLHVSQLCINTAIVYMHRFYVFHSLASFHRNAIAAAALFLAAKVEEQPRKLEHVIKVAHICLHRENPNLDTKSEVYLEQAQDLVFNENVLLQTLGFDVAIDHPHTHVVRCCHLVRASKDLAQTSYFMASNSLHLTTMCLQYKPTVVACFCIHLACKWSNWEIPRSNEGKDWFWYVDKTVTLELLEQLTGEFLEIFDKCPTKLKRKMMSMNQNNTSGFTQQSIPHDGLQFEEPRKLSGTEALKPPEGLFAVQKSNSQTTNDKPGTSSSGSALSSSSLPSRPHHQKIDYIEYREKKERERIEREKQHHHHQQQQRDSHSGVSSNSHHHSKGGPATSKGPSNVQSRNEGTSAAHKGYQQQPHMQQNLHFQNVKENVDNNSGQNFQISRDSKDNNYSKQHPPHLDRDNSKDINYLGQYSQSSNLQHQNFSHKSDSNYSHRDSARGNHSNQYSGSSNLAQQHHNQSHNSSCQNLMSNQRDFGSGNQRDSTGIKDSNEMQSVPQKKDMSSNIRDIIGQTPQVDTHSMTNERKDVRDKNRSNFMYCNPSLPNNKPEILKNGREQIGKVFHDSTDKKVEEFTSRSKEKIFKKEDEEPVIESKKSDFIAPIKSEKHDEMDSVENFGNSGGTNNWNYDFGLNLMNVKNERKEFSVSSKMDSKSEVNLDRNESVKSDLFSVNVETNSSKPQAVPSMRGLYESKYKGHHYPSGNKNSDVSQFKNEKPSAQCSSDLAKKYSDRLHDKVRKSEPDRLSHTSDMGPSGDASKHHKLNKEVQEKHKLLMPGQQHMDQKMKDRSSPSKYAKIKPVPRSLNMEYMKSDVGHFSLESMVSGGSSESDRNEKGSMKLPNLGDDSSKGSFNNVQKQQRSHDFGTPAGMSSTLPDSNIMKPSKTSSIFSPDSKIPPQNILSSLEKDSKKTINPPSHRNHSSNKLSPTTAPLGVKINVPTPATVSTTISNSSSTGSLFSPPLPKPVQTTVPRHRTSSSGSESELIPTITKVEETPGYEKKLLLPSSDKTMPHDKDKTSSNDRNETSSAASLFDIDPKNVPKEKSTESKSNTGRSDSSQFVPGKQSNSVKLSSEIRSDLGAVIYPNNPKSVSVSKSGQTFNLTEPKLSLANSVSTVNLSGIEKMVDTSISPAKQTNAYGAPTSLKSNVATNLNLNLPVSNAFSSQEEKLGSDSKTNAVITNQEIIDVEDISQSDGKKRSDKKKKKDKHKHKDKDRSERKKEKKKHKEKDKERVKEKEKHRDKEKYKEKDKHREKEIDVINSEAPIKITIPKDKISGGLKIKIPKDCLKKEGEVDSPKSGTSSGELKIKISKDKFSHVGTYKEESKSNSKKRDRSPKSTLDLPYPKILKTSDKKISSSSSRSNGTDGSSRNSSSHKHSVSENGSYIDISSLYDFPFEFEENGEGIIKTPDYDFEALNASEDVNTLPEDNKNSNECFIFENSQNESEFPVPAEELYPENVGSSNADVSVRTESASDAFPRSSSDPKPIDEFLHVDSPIAQPVNHKSSPENPHPYVNGEGGDEGGREEEEGKPEAKEEDNCDVLKNYKSILDSHSRRCDLKTHEESSKPRSGGKRTPDKNFDTENPNYYNKYFKKDGNLRNRDKKTGKTRPEDKVRYDDRSKSYDSLRYRNDYPREDRRHFRDFREYNPDPQYYFDGTESRRFEYQKYLPNHFFASGKSDGDVGALNYDINANENATMFPPNKTTQQFICDSNNSLDMNLQYQFGYYNNFVYPGGGYRFYGNVPYVNMSLIHQQPTPPGTGEAAVQLGPPPLPLEPPPDLPPPPETPPPKQV